MAVLLATLISLVSLDWSSLGSVSRAAFSALTVLGVVMLTRLYLAGGEARGRAAGWERRHIDHVYFTYVSLWIGFLVLPILNLPLPEVCVPLTVIAVLAAGHMLLNRYKRGMSSPSRAPGGDAEAAL